MITYCFIDSRHAWDKCPSLRNYERSPKGDLGYVNTEKCTPHYCNIHVCPFLLPLSHHAFGDGNLLSKIIGFQQIFFLFLLYYLIFVAISNSPLNYCTHKALK